jgi:hypothetical protein
MPLTTLPLGASNTGLSAAIASTNLSSNSTSTAKSSNSEVAFSAALGKITDASSSGALTAQTTQLAQANAADKVQSAAKLKTSEGILKTVFDPASGREFVSPIQAAQYGVTNYVDTQPSGLPMPKSLSGYSSKELSDVANQFQMTTGELINKERQAELKSADNMVIKAGIASESNGLTPSQLVEKLKAFKASPPATAKELLEQQSMWADYSNRYANSSWNYANMDGKPQDHSLKPGASIQMHFTGYAAPINQMLSGMNQQSPQFQETAKLLQKHPEINDVVNQLYSINPEQSFFNAINPKYAGGSSPETMSKNFAVGLQNLGSNIDIFGKDVAVRQFLGQQQQLLAVLPDETGKLGNFNLASMSNPQFREIQKIAEDFTPKISDAQWLRQAQTTLPNESKIGELYRDPQSGKGVAIQYAENGKPEAVRLYDASAQVSVVYNDPAKLIEGIYAAGIPLDAFAQLSKQTGKDVLIPSQSAQLDGNYFPKGLEEGVKMSDIASGKLAQVVASDDWLNFQVADVKSKNTKNVNYAGGLNDQISKLKNQNAIAKAFCNELKLTASAASPGNNSPLAAANQMAAQASLANTVESLLGSIDAQLNFMTAARANS